MFLNGSMPAGCRTLVYVLECQRRGHVFSLEAEHTAGYVGCFAPGGCLDSIEPAGFASITLTIPEARFRHALERHGGKISEQSLSRGSVIRVDPNPQTALCRAANGIRELLDGPGEWLANERLRKNLERSLVAAFLDAVTDTGSHDVHATIRRARRYQCYRKAREFIEAHHGEPIHVDDLAAGAGLTRRGLEAVFHDILGISPGAYLRNRRLHGARTELLRSEIDPGVVKRIALDWGFWHLSRFAHDYFALFGEKPSETLPKLVR